MKKSLIIALLLFNSVLHAQDSLISHFSLELNVGLSNPVEPVAPGYDAKTLSPLSVSIGGRYMFNSIIGARFTTGFHQFSNAKEYNSFQTNYFRTDLEGVINLGKSFHFYEWTNKFGLLLHTGGGYSVMKEVNTTKNPDQMINLILGVTPQFKVNDRFSILADFSSFAHIYQTWTYDFSQSNIKRGVDGYLFTFSVGLNYAFGNKTHADWYVPKDLESEISLLNSKIAEIEKQQADDDGDGVANFLDEEPTTAPNAKVNTKGITLNESDLDQDGDGITNATDKCPFEKGTLASEGCPDEDMDGVADRLDDCPFIAGTSAEKGCPSVPETTKNALLSASAQLKFAPKKSDLSASAKEKLNTVAKELLAHPEMKLVVNVHVSASDNRLNDVELSQERAYTIRYYLVGLGVVNERVIALGMGMTQPIGAIDNPETNAQNERVELKIKF